jgi:hypothetical protein
MDSTKIDDLMYQAGLTAQGCWDEMDEYNRTAILKFAELIVRECMDVVADCKGTIKFEHWTAIKEHFGVE